MSDTDYYLDQMPGETRGILARDGEYHALLVQRDDDPIQLRLGTRIVGRVVRVEPGMRAAFIDLNCGPVFGFLSLNKSLRLDVGQKIEVQVQAEPREDKGPGLGYCGPASGDVRILEAGPSVPDIMAQLSGGNLQTGLCAVRASLEAEEAAVEGRVVRDDVGLDLVVQRTRALVAVDIDYAPLPNKDSRRAREQVNRLGLLEAARLIRLKGLAGTIAIDLAGVAFHQETMTQAARAAFADFDKVSFAPISRFGLLQLSLPWTRKPLDEHLADARTAPLSALRQLNAAILEDRTQPVWMLECDPEWFDYLVPLVAALGPRAGLTRGTASGAYTIRRG